ncbi:UDP-glycosyltransferase 83A1 [Brachypodium distachyon]|uniref:Glycosyltransferase n=1 Tax=Brachypodium distachyon TaxID=15368 RepID=I1GN48_BRADI|nr:UDP-glycosyltransferase 83A1 [Brachypodium distachyon]KQK13112.1 hypothetical protein BRADI_1g08140v3 [Brachypodium distachyon]|eukprot:XP_014752266.1 UDP-glycosyltransferase 83A1 [Brachypodium distachyon]
MAAATTQPRVMVLPFPAQGHVIPLMKLSQKLVEHGLEVDFVNTEFNHGRVLEALAEEEGAEAIPRGIHMLSVPDGLGPADDRADIGKFVKDLPAAMSAPLQELIRSRETKWVIADVSMSWALELASAAGACVASFSTYSAAVFALRLSVPKLIADGVIDGSGIVKRHRIQQVPPLDAAEIPWVSLGSTPERRRINVQNVLRTNQWIPLAETVICNTSMEMEPDALSLLPNTLPLGPLVARKSRLAGSFLPEDETCLAWLDAQAPGSVVYVAFGSTGVLGAAQLQELADGLAIAGRPFLWVVRRPAGAGEEDEEWLDAFRRRADGALGMVVGWAPQQRVLAHPAVACFVSHCGWNSTVEGVLHGVPLLCWPYFADQFCNQSYVCNVWGTGVKLCRDEGRGVVAKEEIRHKVARLLGDGVVKARAAMWKKAASDSIREGGSSHGNLLKLVELLREQ